MSQIRIAKAIDIGAFPGSTFVVDDTPPIAQCQETKIDEVLGITVISPPTLTEVGAFVGIDLAGKILDITNPPPFIGTHTILSNTNDVLSLATPPAAEGGGVSYNVHDNGQTYLTRNESSFQRFIENQGKAHTTKGGQLFTDITDPPMDAACSDTFNPQ